MSKSPLAGAFAEGSTPEKKKNKKGAALLIIAGIGLTASVGGVFAANSITINNNADIQFGQGVADTNSCLAALTTTMTQTYDNANDVFEVNTVNLGVVSPATDFSACTGNRLVVKLLDSSGNALGSAELDVAASGGEIADGDTDATINFASDNLDASDVKKITVTTE